LRAKYLNNITEQDHRFIKKITRPTLGFKAFHSATATLAGIKVAHMIRKKQFQTNHTSPFKPFASLAA
jgi:putative transposase